MNRLVKSKLLFVLFLVLFFKPAKVLATDYYVANEGSDKNPGTIDRPWKSTNKVSNTNLRAGDRVFF